MSKTGKTKIEKIVHVVAYDNKNSVCSVIWVLFCRQLSVLQFGWYIFFFNPVFFSLPYRNHGYVPIPFLYLNLVTVLRQIQTIGNFGGELYGRDQAYLLLIVLRQFTE